jgi:integrase
VGLARVILEARLSAVEKGPLFLIESGAVMTSAHIGHYLLTRAARLPIAKFTSHDLRRTFATKLAETGVALDLVAAIVGHESGGSRRSVIPALRVAFIIVRESEPVDRFDTDPVEIKRSD